MSGGHSADKRYDEFMRVIAHELLTGIIKDRSTLMRRKRDLAGSTGIKCIPGNHEILAYLSAQGVVSGDVVDLLRIKPSRSASGVAVVAVMTPPFPCPHGRCIYCPGGITSGTPQSYTGHEPAAMRGAEYGFDGYTQVRARLDQTMAIGHPTDKVDLIIMGGTFPARPPEFQKGFVKSCLDAMNLCGSGSLEEAIALNERAPSRCIGLTIETRPDWCRKGHVDLMLSYGTTRVELGVQTLNQSTIDLVKRAHTIDDVIEATRILKDSGLKVGYHLMPGLPGESPQSDFETFKKVFEDERFRPDLLKIYPTLVIEGTELYEMYRRGEYTPYSTEECVDLISRIKGITPKWVRISRVQRDIPAQYISAGCKKSDLRNLVHARMKEMGMACMCIRCREVGRISAARSQEEPSLQIQEYTASGGREVFISVEDQNALYGFLRLRFPSSDAYRPEIRDGDAAIVREIRVLGHAVPLGKRLDGRYQHTGIGRTLMEKAESVAEDRGASRILVTSGVGVREYFRSLGYTLHGPYMEKHLR